MCRQAGHDQRGEQRARSGHHLDRETGVETGPHEVLARIGHARGSRVGHVRDARTTADRVDDLTGGGELVVRVHGPETAPRGDARVGEQRTRATGVLGGDEVRVAELVDGAGREVAEIADRRRDEHERRLAVRHSRTSTQSPTRNPQRSNAPTRL